MFITAMHLSTHKSHFLLFKMNLSGHLNGRADYFRQRVQHLSENSTKDLSENESVLQEAGYEKKWRPRRTKDKKSRTAMSLMSPTDHIPP